MPEISRFFGIIIRMYWEVNEPHHLPHFHAYYQGWGAVELVAGEIPRRQSRLVEGWAELHQKELRPIGNVLQSGRVALPIDPLR